MAKIRVNKIDAARRQIDEAIRLLFANGDPVAVHTLVAAGFRILRDLSDKGGKGEWGNNLKKIIKPGKEKEFWHTINTPANFFKHAGRDPDEILDNVDESVNDIVLSICCVLYADLGYEMTIEMKVLFAWSHVLYPDLLEEGALKEMFSSRFKGIRSSARAEQLQRANALLTHTRIQQQRRYK